MQRAVEDCQFLSLRQEPFNDNCHANRGDLTAGGLLRTPLAAATTRRNLAVPADDSDGEMASNEANGFTHGYLLKVYF